VSAHCVPTSASMRAYGTLPIHQSRTLLVTYGVHCCAVNQPARQVASCPAMWGTGFVMRQNVTRMPQNITSYLCGAAGCWLCCGCFGRPTFPLLAQC
jgi:hypothetical protein